MIDKRTEFIIHIINHFIELHGLSSLIISLNNFINESKKFPEIHKIEKSSLYKALEKLNDGE